MPSALIIKKNNFKTSFRTQSIIDRHELKPESADFKIDVSIPIENREWSIGVIVGSSGSGKSTIAKECFGNYLSKERSYSDHAVVDEMPKERSIDEISKVFNSVGFGTIWHWLKPYSVLSFGERMRVDLARELLEEKEIVVFDEFTSVVDREIAKVASFSVNKAVRKSKKKFIAVTCHRDVIEWLEPDWVFDTDKKQFFFVRDKSNGQNSKSISLNVLRTSGNILETFTI